MRVLEGLMPERVFYYFEEICKIPHGSGNLDGISSYLERFAKEKELFNIRDVHNNIIIVKEASEGYEDVPPIMLQGHMDMVAVKDDDCDINLETDAAKAFCTRFSKASFDSPPGHGARQPLSTQPR